MASLFFETTADYITLVHMHFSNLRLSCGMQDAKGNIISVLSAFDLTSYQVMIMKMNEVLLFLFLVDHN